MKPQKLVPVLLLFAAASLPFSTAAATDMDKTPAADSAPEAQKAKAKAKKAKRHSHMQEKTGIAPAEKPVDRESGAAKADKDKSKHFHPRDR